MSDLISYSQWPPGSALVIRRMAHDLMAPLTVLAGNLQLFALRDDLPDGMHTKINELYEQTNVLVNLIRKTTSYAGEKVWSGDSGELWQRFQEGAYFAGSVLAKNGIHTKESEPKCTFTLKGEPQFWSEWFASLLASIGTIMEPQGEIILKNLQNGFQLIVLPVDKNKNNFDEWIHMIASPELLNQNPAIRIYALGLMLSQLECKFQLNENMLFLNYVPKND